jgi:signal transduction histidine kinase
VDWVVPIHVATAATELLAALVFASLYLRRRAERPYGIASLLGLVAAARSASILAAAGPTHMHRTAGLAPQLVGDAAFALSLAITLDFAFAFARRRIQFWHRGAIYAVAIALSTLEWARAPVEVGSHAAILTLLAGVIATGITLLLVAQAYRARVDGALPVVVGATILVATAVNDLGTAAGLLTSAHLMDAGLAVFIVSVATTPGARFAVLSRDLERRTQELQTSARELKRSYDDLRKIQEELLKKEQLAVVGELAAVIAHEVRNPLAVIANAGAGLRKPAISREDQDVLLAILDEETSRLNRLVSDLLRYARPVSVQRTQIALRDLLERALALASAGAKTVQTDLQMDAHEGRLWGDANLLRQVFDNLIDNAVQAMSGGGRLTIRVRTWNRDGADGLGVDIIDTGEGMDTQVRSRALDPFFTTRPSGTGLGLAIVDRIIEAHGGNLDIDSRTGEGTTVTVFLPHGSPSDPPPLRSRGLRPATEARPANVETPSSPAPGVGQVTR